MKNYNLCCDYCLRPIVNYHCDDIPGKFRGCHESFSTPELLAEHHHPRTGGCRYPGNIEDYYEIEGIWFKKEKKPEEENDGELSKVSRGTRSRIKVELDRGRYMVRTEGDVR